MSNLPGQGTKMFKAWRDGDEPWMELGVVVLRPYKKGVRKMIKTTEGKLLNGSDGWEACPMSAIDSLFGRVILNRVIKRAGGIGHDLSMSIINVSRLDGGTILEIARRLLRLKKRFRKFCFSTKKE